MIFDWCLRFDLFVCLLFLVLLMPWVIVLLACCGFDFVNCVVRVTLVGGLFQWGWFCLRTGFRLVCFLVLNFVVAWLWIVVFA